MFHRHGLIMAWLPDPKEFFQVNRRELMGMIKHQCEKLDVPEEEIPDVIQEFLYHLLRKPIKYDPKFIGKNGKPVSVTTYMYACSERFVWGWKRTREEETRRARLIVDGTPIYEESLKHQNRPEEDMNSRMDLETFFRKINEGYPHNPNRKCDAKAMFRDSLVMVGHGYEPHEVAKKHNISGVYLSYVRGYMRKNYKELITTGTMSMGTIKSTASQRRKEHAETHRNRDLRPVRPYARAEHLRIVRTRSEPSPKEQRRERIRQIRIQREQVEPLALAA